MAEQELTPNLQKILSSADINNNLIRGLRQACKAIESNFGPDFQKRAALCVLAKDVNDDNYGKLIRALCKDRNVPLLEVDKRVDLGQWSGLCKYDETETARNVRPTGVVVVTEFPADQIAAVEIVKQHLQA